MEYFFSSFTTLFVVILYNCVCVEGSDAELPIENVSGKLLEEGGMMFKALDIFAPTSDKITNEICRKHSLIFKKELIEHKLWALRMYDSTAKLPSGILTGQLNQLGDFDQCLTVGADDVSSIKGKYCLALVHITAVANSTLNIQNAVNLAESYRLIQSSHSDPAHFLPRFTTFRWGLCIPASCSSTDVEQALEDALADYATSGIMFDVRVHPETCYTEQDNQKFLPKASLYTFMFFGVVLGLAIIASVLDKKKKHQNEQGKIKRMLLTFSIYRNIGKLNKELPSEGDINCIHGIRSICTIGTYLAHRLVLVLFNTTSNRQTILELGDLKAGVIFRTSFLFPDSFFLLSGVLAAFNLSKDLSKEKESNFPFFWFKKCYARWLRLTPPVAALVLFFAYVMEYLGTGPQWNLVVKKNADLCKEKFWQNFLYLQNLSPFEEACAAHTHHLASEMQLFILSPLLVRVLQKRQGLGFTILCFLCILSTVLRYQVVFQHELSYFVFHGISVNKLYQIANTTFCIALHRATPYVLGVGLGYFLHKSGKNFHIPKFALTIGWIIAACFVYASMLSPYHVGYRDYKYDVHEASLYAAQSSLLWALNLCWVIFICYTGHGGWFNNFLSSKFFVLCSRMSYAVYLTQFIVFYCINGSLRTMHHFSLAGVVDFGELLVVASASLCLILLFEYPFLEVKNILTEGDKRKVVSEVSKGSTTAGKVKYNHNKSE